jgi:hypothetical protein
MALEKLLILETDWQEGKPAGRLYGSVAGLPAEPPLICRRRPFLAATYLQELRDFLSLPANRKGVNVAVFSAHGQYQPGEPRMLKGMDGRVDLGELRGLRGQLDKSIFILDACQVGSDLHSFISATGALGVLGFQKQVNWLASSVLVLALLRRFHQEGVFHMRRHSPIRPRKILDSMLAREYNTLMGQLGVTYLFP